MIQSNRNNQLAKWRTIINRDSYPRLEMFLLVSFTGMAAFLTSFSLFHFGFNTIWLRYLVSMGVAYIVFMGLLGIWLAWKTNRATTNLDGLEDLSDLTLMSTSNHSASFHGGGGSFDGGGASGNYDSGESAGFVGEALGAAAQAEEAAIPLIVVGALIFALLSIFIFTFSLVSSAPILFSELLVDGMLSASLYNRLKGVDSHHWLESAIKRTFWPFVFFTLTFIIVGWTMQHFMPEVNSLGEVIRHLISK
jgi:hypothetical protein